MHSKLLAVLLVLFLAPQAFAGESLFNSTATMKEEVHTLKSESLNILCTPLDTENHGLLCTLAVAGGVGLTYIFDDGIRRDFRANRSRTLDYATDMGSAIGDPLLHLGIVGAIYGGSILAGSKKCQETWQMLGEAALLGDTAGLVLKTSIGRERPFVQGDKARFRPFQFASDYDSMPSLHVVSSFAMASVLSAASESLGAKMLFYSGAAFVGLSRIYQDQHWASDVVFSAAVGELCGRAVERYHNSTKQGMVLLPIISGHSASIELAEAW